MRGGPFASEALGFSDLGRGHQCLKGITVIKRKLPIFTGLSRRREVPPLVGLYVVLHRGLLGVALSDLRTKHLNLFEKLVEFDRENFSVARLGH